MSDIGQKVIKEIAQYLGQDVEKLKPENKFVEDLGADSLDIVELITQLEMVFDIKIPDEDAEKLVTVGDAVSYIESKVTPPQA